MLGETVADSAEVIDRHGHELHTYDRDGNVANEVEYHPLQAENERLAYEHGIVVDAFEAPPGRDEPLGLTHHLLMNGLLASADSGFACPVAMTGGAALVLGKFTEDSPRPDLLFDVVAATVLLGNAQYALAEENDARKTVVARLFVDSRFGERAVRGITDGRAPGDE